MSAETLLAVDNLIRAITKHSNPLYEEKSEAPVGLSKEEFQTLKEQVRELVTTKQCAPILVRLAWHDSGTYCKNSKSGGSRGCMRFKEGESTHGANAGLHIARELVAPLQKLYCDTNKISIADLWCFIATYAIEVSGGPSIPFQFGRGDAKGHEDSVPDGRLPDATKKMDHLRDVFYRMGFNDREIVALSGAHTLGRCHSDRSGFNGPWTEDPLTFDNQYYVDLLNKNWTEMKCPDTNNPQFKSDVADKSICPNLKNNESYCMMLISDLALLEQNNTKAVVEEYAKSQDVFFKDFAKAWQRLVELGYSQQQLYSLE